MISNNNIKLLLIVILLLIYSCSYTYKVPIEYEPLNNLRKLPGVESVVVDVEVEDKREDKIVFGEFNTSNIESDDNPILVIENSVKSELRRKGFKLANGNVLVNIQLINFTTRHVREAYNVAEDFLTCGKSAYTPKNVASIYLNIKVYDVYGSEYYSNKIIKSSEEYYPGGSLWSEEEAFSKVLSTAIYSLIEDQNFINAIIKASKEKGMG